MGKFSKGQAERVFPYESMLIEQFNKIYNSLPDIEVFNQMNSLKYMFNYVKTCHEKGMSEEEIELEIEKYIENLVNKIEDPTLNSFYRLRTLEYIIKEKMDLTPHIKAIIERQKFNPKNQVRLSNDEDFDYSADINQNIELALCNTINFFASEIKETTDKRFNEICNKIKNGSLVESDIPDLLKYFQMALNHLVIGRKQSWEKLLREDSDLVCKTILANLDKIVEVTSAENVDIATLNLLEKTQTDKMMSLKDIAELSKNQQMQFSSIAFDVAKPKVAKVKKKTFLSNPFLGRDKINNILIHANDLFTLDNPDSLNTLYNACKQTQKDKRLKGALIKTFSCMSYGDNSMKLRPFLRKRIEHLINFFDETGDLEAFNSLNNDRLKLINLDGLVIDTEDYKDKISNTNLCNCKSTEMLTAMSAFYTNRLSKVQSKYSIAEFIFRQDGIVKRICENPNLKFEDLGYTEESVREGIAKYELLKKLMIQRFLKDFSSEEFFKIGSEEGIYLLDRLEESLKGLEEYSKPYKKHFGGSISDDSHSIYQKYLVEREIYALKDYSIYTLLYTAIVDKGNNVVNWGYIKEGEDSDKYKVLIAFDVKGLNMPVSVHIGRKELQSFMEILTGKKQIPVYEGADDMYVLPTKQYYRHKLLSTQVLYPITSTQRAFIKKGNNKILQHLAWIQRPSKKPNGIKYEPGSRVYDFELDKIVRIKNSQDTGNQNVKKSKNKKQDNPDEPSI